MFGHDPKMAGKRRFSAFQRKLLYAIANDKLDMIKEILDESLRILYEPLSQVEPTHSDFEGVPSMDASYVLFHDRTARNPRIHDITLAELFGTKMIHIIAWYGSDTVKEFVEKERYAQEGYVPNNPLGGEHDHVVERFKNLDIEDDGPSR